MPTDLDGAVLARDVAAGGDRFAKGTRLTSGALARIAADGPAEGVTVLVPGPDDVHEDDAAMRLAAAMAGGGIDLRGPAESRVDLVAATRGVVRIRVRDLERLSRIDPIDAFSVLDRQVVEAGDLVAAVKVAPHVVAGETVRRGEALARAAAPIVAVAPFTARRIGVIVEERLAATGRERFERSIRLKVAWLGSTLTGFAYAGRDPDALESAVRAMTGGTDAVDIVLAAGAGSSDPGDPLFVAFARAGGRIVRRGAPAHPGSMLWLGRLRATTIIGLASCGAYSKATSVDLLLPWILAGDPPTGRTMARLAYGGILTREMRFRFPAYARDAFDPDR